MFARFLTAAFVALPFFVQAALADSCTRRYTVQAGDICDSISYAQNVSSWQLAANNYPTINQLCTNLIPGSSLCLGYPNEDCTTTYRVVAGDTCDQISSNFNVNSTILYLNNPQINAECTNIYVGEVLCTSNQVQVPPAPGGPVASPPPTATLANPTPSSTSSSSSTTSTTSTSSTTSTTSTSSTPSPTPTPTPTPTPSTSTSTADDNLPYCDEL